MSSSDGVATSFAVVVFSVSTMAFAEQHDPLVAQQELSTSRSFELYLLVNGHSLSVVVEQVSGDIAPLQHPDVPFTAAEKGCEVT
jgi:hypothetical protein